MGKTAEFLHAVDHVPRGPKRIHVSSASGQPAVDAVGQSGCVRYGDIQSAAPLHHSADLAQAVLQLYKMLQAVVTDNCVEGLGAEWHLAGVGHNVYARPM